MSIVWSLKQLFDPATHREEEGERQAEREEPRHTHAGDPPRFEVAVQPPVATPVQRFRCRVCSYGSQASAYCPVCLADTMVPAAGAAGAAGSETLE